jgi:hypothetical protein
MDILGKLSQYFVRDETAGYARPVEPPHVLPMEKFSPPRRKRLAAVVGALVIAGLIIVVAQREGKSNEPDRDTANCEECFTKHRVAVEAYPKK